jgi:Zn-dependent protease with chaperone function
MKETLSSTLRRPPNLFSFPTETDVRFRLMVLLVAGSSLGLGALAAQAVLSFLALAVERQLFSELFALLSSMGTLIVIFGLASWRARRTAAETIRQDALQPFPPLTSDPSAQASFQQMQVYVAQLIMAIPALARRPLQLYWDARDPRPSGTAFGFGRRRCIVLRDGMHAVFRALPDSQAFPAILLHELAHLANDDLDKVTFTNTLDRTFREVATGLLIILDGLTLLALVGGAIFGTTRTFHETRLLILLVAAVNVLLLVQMALIRVVRASVLCAREHYADLRARDWLGDVEPLNEVLRRAGAESEPPPQSSNAFVGVGLVADESGAPQLIDQVYNLAARLNAVHPPFARRVAVLDNASELCRLRWGTMLLSGLLIGLALNAGMNFVSLTNVLLTLDGIVAQRAQASSDLSVVQTLSMLSLVLELGWALTVLSIWLGLGLLPIVGTLGIQMQVDAFAARVRPGRNLAIAPAVLILSTGIVVGGALAPVPNSFSLWGRALALAPLLILAWAIVLTAWALPLRIIAARLFAAHRGERPPDAMRRWLTTLSTLALAPGLLVLYISQIVLSPAVAFGELVGLPIAYSLGALLVALCISVCVWGVGLLLMKLMGLLDPPACAACRAVSARRAGLQLWCSSCGTPLMDWALPAPPIALPFPPTPLQVPSNRKAPPL